MDEDSPAQVAVITTLIYGNKASAPMTEEGMKQFAKCLQPSQPRLADFLECDRFVDDLNTSEPSKEAIDQLQKDADDAFVSLGMESKDWAKTGELFSSKLEAVLEVLGSFAVQECKRSPCILQIQPTIVLFFLRRHPVLIQDL